MEIRFRTMTPNDIAGGMRLKTTAGWNQTEADWRRFLEFDADGTFVAEAAGRIVGTVSTIAYEDRIAWIGMMLVDPGFRRRGIGEGLMRMALDHLRFRKISVIGLDATPMGRPLYERLGFVASSSLHRWSLDRCGMASKLSHSIDAHETHEYDLDAICRLDGIAFGADRSRLIRSFVVESPTRVVTCSDSRVPDGSAVLIARQGAVADHLSAWLAPSATGAAKLLDMALARTALPVVIADVPAEHAWAGAVLSARGFRIARDLTRMYLADSAEVAQPVAHAAILGPEFG